MAPLRIFLPYLWRAFWRDVRSPHSWQGANLVLAILFAQLAAFRIWSVVSTGATRLSQDLPGGVRIVTLGLGQMLLIWSLLPIVTAMSSLRRGIFPPAKLRHLPVSISTLGGVAAAGSFIHPAYWIVLAASVFSLLPISLAFGPVGVLSSLLFLLDLVLWAWWIGITTASRASSRAQLRASAILSATAPLFVFALLARGFRHEVELGERAASFLGWTPAGWTAAAWGRQDPLAPIALLAFFALALTKLGASEIKRSLGAPDASISRGGSRGRGLRASATLRRMVGRRAASLFAKEWSYLVRNIDSQLGFGLSIGAALLFARLDQPYLWIPMLALPLLVSTQAASWNNPFGLDRRGVDRYRLLPVRGREVLAAKNGAAAALLLLQTLPLVIATVWRGHPLAAIALGFAAVAYLGFGLAIGNVIGLRWPAAREFYHWDNLSQSGGPIAVLGYLAFTGALILTVAATASSGEGSIALGFSAWAVGATILYGALGPGSGRRFETSAAEMRARLER